MSELGWEHALEAARKLWGQETSRARGGKELRFGAHGSKSLRCDGDDGPVWYDHEEGVGGGVHDLCLKAGTIKPSPWDDPGWRAAAMEYAAKQRGGANDYSKYYQEARDSEPGEVLARLAQPPPSWFKSDAEFIADFTPPNYLVKRLLIQSYLYSLTGATGSGKTAITLLLALCVATGTTFAGLKSKPRRVLYLAAENPADTRYRWIALKQQYGCENRNVPVWFVENIFNIEEMNNKMRAEAMRVGGDFGLVIIDTGPAFFQGDDANDRVDMFKHARMMRDLIDIIPGKPVVIANMHPVKNAGPDNLIPAGGGSFLNEVDGNLTVSKDDTTVDLHWQGKLRGAEFNPLSFDLLPATHERLKDDDGDLIPTVVARHISDHDKEVKEAATQEDWKQILDLIDGNSKISLAKIATAMGWEERKWKAQRMTNAMIRAKLVKRNVFGEWELTASGQEVVDDHRSSSSNGAP